MLGEVVVNTGLYKRPAGNFTGASKTFTGEELKNVNPSNVLQALSVVEPSVRIEQNNALGSDPNQLPIIQLRRWLPGICGNHTIVLKQGH